MVWKAIMTEVKGWREKNTVVIDQEGKEMLWMLDRWRYGEGRGREMERRRKEMVREGR